MTNSPRYDLQLAVNDYWKEVGGLNSCRALIVQVIVLYALLSIFMLFRKTSECKNCRTECVERHA